MSKEKIEELLKKYWEGETSIEEERLIKQHFALGKENFGYNSEAEYFSKINDFREIEIVPIVKLNFLPPRTDRKKEKKSGFFKYISIAALIAITVLVSKFTYDQIRFKNNEAIEMAHSAEKDLMEISNSLNEGYQDHNVSIIENRQ